MNFTVRGIIAAALAVAGASIVPGAAQAALITDCPLGATVCYEYDDAQAAVALMGTPTRVGNDMQFLPSAFLAESNGAGFVTAGPANFIFSRVWTPSGAEIASITVYEYGDYEIVVGGDVRANLFLQARSNLLSTDGVSTLVTFTDAGDTAGPQLWDLTGTIATASTFTALANDMRVTVQDTLRANAAPGQYAFIQKKFTMQVTTVPVPAAVWMLGSGLAALGLVRRRSAAA